MLSLISVGYLHTNDTAGVAVIRSMILPRTSERSGGVLLPLLVRFFFAPRVQIVGPGLQHLRTGLQVLCIAVKGRFPFSTLGNIGTLDIQRAKRYAAWGTDRNNLRALAKVVEIVRPGLHHLPPLM